MSALHEATKRQIDAAHPSESTWLSANAGSGKTRVLTDRVARLLLSGVDPQKILCLTYTRAAASEMQNRLFRRLGDWAMRPDKALAGDLAKLGVTGNLGSEDLRRARRLFASAVETPGGLKIQTIHSFCSALLRRFPLEAGVSPQFTELDDQAATLLRADIVEAMAEGDDADLVRALAEHYRGDDLAGLTSEIVQQRDRHRPVERSEMAERFGVSPDLKEGDIAATAFRGGEDGVLFELVSALSEGSSNDLKAADRLRPLLAAPLTTEALPILEAVFLNGAGAKSPFAAKTGVFPTKATREAHPELCQDLDDWMERVEAAREFRVNLKAVDRNLAFNAFSSRFLDRYTAEKQVRGWLDFTDQILKARDLLSDPGVADWVLYRLDGGIDHILVDEAQDTSPQQWQVIDRLSQEFTSGEGARQLQRTIFVVGDKKQSIYSFQGADPAGFDQMGGSFGARLKDVGAGLVETTLDHSFRSSSAILEVVDRTLSGEDGIGASTHATFWEDLPGRVDLWPLLPPQKDDDEDEDWTRPVDRITEAHHTVILARAIAKEIKRLIDQSVAVPCRDENDRLDFRPARPGDFLILFRSRNQLFREVNRACKDAGLDIAGVDRIRVGQEMAVRDIIALLSFLSLPEDDLSLAEALKSPLFGWSEQALFDLAHRRPDGSYLWEALRKNQAAYPETLAILSDLLKWADFLRPYDLIERLLVRHEGRKKLVGRLGEEADEGIDAFLSQAMDYERLDVPSLTGFLAWLEADEVEFKRQTDNASDRVRVMTVHGAKGLEAPVVVLPDTIARQESPRENVLPAAGETGVIWKTAEVERSRAEIQAFEQLKRKQQEERARLLYVAMTRAESWLIICGAGKPTKGRHTWYEKIEDGMGALGVVGCEFPVGEGKRYEHGTWPATTAAILSEPTSVDDADLAGPWVQSLAPPPTVRATPLSPSDLGGAKALPGEGLDEESALRRGRQIHLLLEKLPGAPAREWPKLAGALFSGEDAARPEETTDLLAEVKPILEDPALEYLFSNGGLSEVSITADIPPLGRIHGAIDRLIVQADRILAVDFKSNAVVPELPDETPEGILRQMGAYAMALAQIYPNRTVETAILWTRTARLMALPHDLVRAALQRAAPP